MKKSIDEIAKYAKEIHENQEKSQKDPTVLVQRYIEKPLIVHGRKFDIRQWFLVTSFDPVKDWIKRIKKYLFCFNYKINPHTPVAQKVADEVVFRRFQGEGVEVF